MRIAYGVRGYVVITMRKRESKKRELYAVRQGVDVLFFAKSYANIIINESILVEKE